MMLHLRCFLLLCFIVIVTLTLSCSEQIPPPGPITTERCCLGISLKMIEKVGPLPVDFFAPDNVLFIRLEEGEGLDDLTQKTRLIPASRIRGEHAYLYNVPKGTYVAVAAIHSEFIEPTDIPIGTVQVGDHLEVGFNLGIAGFENITRSYFSREMVEQTLITVDEGSFGFMGTYEANQPLRFGEGDAVQLHFLRVIEGDDRPNHVNDLMGDGNSRRLELGKVNRDQKAKIEFCRKARKHLVGSQWGAMVDHILVSQ